MRRIDLMISNGTIKEFRPESAWAYRRRIRRQMRYVDPPYQTALAALDVIFWLLVAAAAAACVIGVPVLCVRLFVRWWLCM